jgi:hypothetical protein
LPHWRENRRKRTLLLHKHLAELATLSKAKLNAMTELILFSGVVALFGLAFWLATDSDDDNGGGGLMQPVLVPVRVQRSR